MISVIIPTLNADERFAACLTALVPAAVEGVVREVIVVDAGSTDHTLKIADQAGVDVVVSEAGRGLQLRAGARRARQPWLLFLHADTVLSPGWDIEAVEFMERVDNGRHRPMAATFSFGLDDYGAAPRILEWLVAMRGLLLGLPYGDQGLLIPRQLYDEVGGFQPMPLMEDVAIVRRIGRRRIWRLRAGAVTGSSRYRAEGYLRRVMRNQLCIALYAAGVSPARIANFYANGAHEPRNAEAPRSATDAAPPERRRRVNSA
ncbi:MAG: TIGR04283 family arsenosugar biosynthesis glycosyltransferase [Hyphomicrobiaceae bacterium]|nr:TIGR04283 family arsenosugar biosynthesis glycosyltransferase [Hyphomicrobiaceae bacterium]